MNYSLLYHSFSDEDKDFYFNTINYEKFYRDIILLKNAGFNFKNTFDLESKPTIYITFDDGYKSVMNVLDFCESNSIPVLFFICSEFLESRLLPKDKIRQICRNIPKGGKINFLDKVFIVKNDSFIYRENLSMRLNNIALDSLSYIEYKKIIDNFYTKYEYLVTKVDSDLELLDRTDIEKIKRLKMCKVGSHGKYHYSYERMSKKEVAKDMNDSKKLLSYSFGHNIEMISYPYGNFNNDTSQIANQYFEKALTVVKKNVNINQFHIDRISIDSMEMILK